MSDTSTEDGFRTFSVRWPAALVDEIDRRSKADRRPRNQWLEMFVEEKLNEKTWRIGDPVVCDLCGHEHHVGPPDNRCTDPTCSCAAPILSGSAP